MHAFPLNFMVGGRFLLKDSFHRFSGEKPGELHEIFFCGGFPHGEIEWRSLCFALCLFIYLFIYCLFVCLLFNYFKGAVCCFMHQLCGLAPWGLWGVGRYFCVLVG